MENKKIRLVHSFWSKPSFIDRYGMKGGGLLAKNVWIAALSVLYAKQCGFEIVLHTDSVGKELFECLPYDEIYETLENIPDYIDPHFWAAPKVYAMREEPLGSIHIDIDVFIKKPEILDVPECDLFTQSYEVPCYSYRRAWNKIGAFVHHTIDGNLEKSLNCGVIGFRNQTLKDTYLDFYISKVEEISKKGVIFYNYDTPDLVLEQCGLWEIAKDYNTIVLFNDCEESEEKIRKGYQHLMTMSKYSDETIEKVKALVKSKDKQLYKNIEECLIPLLLQS